MRLPPTLKTILEWLRTLFQNQYFWGGLGGLLLLGITAYVLIDAVIMPSYTRHGVSVQVPNVEDQPFSEAKERVESRNLTVKRQVGRYNPNVERETVVDQTPLPNSDVKPGRRVYLTVNAGDVPRVLVPDLSGISLREAENRIASLGLNTGTVEPDSIPSPYPNTITRQLPEPGDSLKQGAPVDLWYSTGLGTDTVQVPSVVGHTVEEGKRLLLQRNLRAVVVNSNPPESSQDAAQSADTSATQFVQRQGRGPDTQVRTGTEIRLFTTDDSTQVPDPETDTVENPTAVPN